MQNSVVMRLWNRGRNRGKLSKVLGALASLAALAPGRAFSAPYRSGRVARAAEQRSSSDVNDVPFALILPGFLGSCEDFEDLAEDMRRAGYAAAVAPIAWWHWVPCIGGRSMRPILERIDHAVNQVLTSDFKVKSLASPSYTIMDFFSDFMSNPGGIFQVGGTDDPAEFPPVKPAGDFRCDIPGKGQRIAIVAHSASGWISRLFLSSLEYQGRSFHGADKIHSLVCLGSPHFVANNLVYKNLEYLESKCGKDLPPNVRCLCVGSKGNVISEASDMTRGAYEFCGATPGDEAVDGDGMTPLFSAIAFEAADKLVLENVSHAPVYPAFGPSAELAKERRTKPWYGSPSVLQQWLPWLTKNPLD
ncbi:unnamed protein product [Cladocopium goreaui]|uniref:Uncharacterized protein n=1 Tax=Cladocopium goreaui TaxID=2562237 RepID=A0A9P1GQ48_9DINO|nr:unnamed protein product [Cladocopium goreaui]